MEYIDYKDFEKLDLRIGKIKSVEEIENSEKLIKLKVDIGEEERQIVAGIKGAYSKEELLERNIVVVINLKPITLMGEESNGMLLAASGEKPILLEVLSDVSPGTSVR